MRSVHTPCSLFLLLVLLVATGVFHLADCWLCCFCVRSLCVCFQYGGFVEVFVDTPIAVCERRDRKGLYKRAREVHPAH